MATKGNNNTTKSSSSKRNSTNTKNKSSSKTNNRTNNSKKNTKNNLKIEEEIRLTDPYMTEITKEIILWTSIAIAILLIISNFGFGGSFGSALAGLFFGIFGIVQYIIPVLGVISAFFIISNYGNKVAVIKVIAAFVFVMFISFFVELIIHGENIFDLKSAFDFSSEYKNGGGLIGAGLALILVNNIGLAGAYIVDIIVMIVCAVMIFEKFAFDRIQHSNRYRADRAANKRIERVKRQQIERAKDQERLESERSIRQQLIREELDRQSVQEFNDGSPRSSRKRSGVTSNTSMFGTFCEDTQEIKINLGDDKEVVSSARTKLKANNKNSKSNIDLYSQNTIELGNVGIAPVEEELEVKEITPEFIPVINTPKPQANTSFTERKPDNTEKTLKETIKEEENKTNKPYRFPPLNLLNEPRKGAGDSKSYLNEMAQKLQRTLSNFGVSARVSEVTLGPSVTRYEIEIAEGTKVSKVVNLSDDIKLSMAVTDVRIEAPIPGKSAIGIEVPNKEKTLVGFRELVSSKAFKESKSKIAFCVGKDISGEVIVGNIEKMPHLLIAGATGSGKSVCINTIIMSILYHADPNFVKLIMVDPKMVELSVYNGIPHLLLPVITDAKKAAGALHWAVKEMTDRYELMKKVGVRNIEGYNEKFDAGLLQETFPDDNMQRMTQIVIILDELADLMMVAAADVEESIVRLAQLARACGIHLIIATQRPTANVITGLIKANVPSRIAFSVASGTDSRVILDMTGAEDLLGNGDMLYAPQNLSKPIRVQGAFVSDEEVAKVVDYIKNNNAANEYDTNISAQIDNNSASGNSVSIGPEPDNSLDSLFADAGRLVIENQKGSIGYLQRNFRIGFNRAARIMDQLCEAKVVGPEVGTKPREIRMSIVEFEELLQKNSNSL